MPRLADGRKALFGLRPTRADVAAEALHLEGVMSKPETGGDEAPKAGLADADREAVEAAVFRRLAGHFRARTDVQNIDLMEMAGFCRNCLSDWYAEAARERGHALEPLAAREIVYGMPYSQWKSQHQTPVSSKRFQAFAKSQK